MPKMYEKLHRNKDFITVFQKGKRHSFGGVLLSYIPNALAITRIGFVVSTKFSPSAVVRNKQKRILRAAIHDLAKNIPLGFDIVISYTNHGKMLPYKEAVHILEKLIKKISQSKIES